MFETLISNNFIEELMQDSRKFIKDDRNTYKKITDHILEFCSKNKLVISDVEYFLDKKNYWDSIKIFTINPETYSKKLLKELCEKFGKEFMLRVKDVEELYVLEHDTRELCAFNLIKLYKKFSLYDFITPVKHNDAFMMPPVIEIINLYTRLYNPIESDYWPEILDDINKLNPHIDSYFKKLLSLKEQKQLNELISTHFTGKPLLMDKNAPKYVDIKQVKKYILDYLEESNYILINSAAYNVENEIEDDSVIEILSKNNIESDYKLLMRYMDKYVNYGIVFKKKDMYIPGELLLSKYVIYLLIPHGSNFRKMQILNIYNNMTYELVNYKDIYGYKIADPITQMKFLYASIWNSIISQKAHGLRLQDFQKYLKDKMQLLEYYKKNIDIYEKKQNYYGVYINISIMKKISALSGNPFKGSYLCYEI